MLDLDIAPDSETRRDKAERMVASALGVERDARGDGWLRRVSLRQTMTLDPMAELRRRAQEEAIPSSPATSGICFWRHRRAIERSGEDVQRVRPPFEL